MKTPISRGARTLAATAAILMAMAGCAATQDAAAPDSSQDTPAVSASVVGDTNGGVQPIPTECSDGHLSLQIYNNTGNTLTLSTSQPPSEDDGGMYIDDGDADCTWPAKSGPWSTTGAWMMVNTSNVTGEGEMSSEIYWNLDDKGDVLHAHGWGDYNSDTNAEGTDSTAGSCEVTGPNAADFNCHEHNEWMESWDHGFAHFTLTCTNPSSSSACIGYKQVLTPVPTVSIPDTTIADMYIQYPSGASSSQQPYMNQFGWVNVSYVFPAKTQSNTGYQVYFGQPAASVADPNFVIGYDTCTGNTFVAVPNGSSSQVVCQLGVQYNSPYTGSGTPPANEPGALQLSINATGSPYGLMSAALDGIVGATTVRPVALPEAVTGVAVSAPKTTATITWSMQDPGPENAPVTYGKVTAIPGTPSGTPAPTAAVTTQTCSVSGGALSGGYPIPNTCSISGLVAGIPYTFTVVAANSVGTGPASKPVVFTPGGPPQAAPTNLSAKYSNAGAGGNNQYVAVISFTQVPASKQGSSTLTGVFAQGYLSGKLDPNTTKFCSGASSLSSCTVIIPTNELLQYIQGNGTFTLTACNGAANEAPSGCGPVSAPVTPALPKSVPVPSGDASGPAATSASPASAG